MKRLDPNRPCADCGRSTPEVLFLFPANTRDKVSRKHPQCQECWSKRKKIYDYKRRYGITPEDVDLMYKSQLGLCVICKRSIIHPSDVKTNQQTHIDHDHKSDRVRGLLCWMCNRGLGDFRDDTEVLHRAIAYVQEHK